LYLSTYSDYYQYLKGYVGKEEPPAILSGQ